MAEGKRKAESLLINHRGMEWRRMIKSFISKIGSSSIFQTCSEFCLLRQWPPKCSFPSSACNAAESRCEGAGESWIPILRGQGNKRGAVKAQTFSAVSWESLMLCLINYNVMCMEGEGSKQISHMVCVVDEISAPWYGYPKGDMLVTCQRSLSQSQSFLLRASGHV